MGMTGEAGSVVLRGRVVEPGRVVEDGAVVMQGSRIAWVGSAAEAPAQWAAVVAGCRVEPGRVLLPGLVDLHDHGGGGAGFPDVVDLAEARVAVAEHAWHGTTALVASLVTAPSEVLLRRTALLAELADADEIAGIHLEGPFLAPSRCGAQNPADMRTGDAGLVRELAAAARGHLVTMTVAPEVAGVADGSSHDVLSALLDVGALPSFGHTEATAEQVDAAVAEVVGGLAGSGRRASATHLFNGMPVLHHRAPGPVAALLGAAARGELVVELVADGTHLAAATVRMVFDLLGPDAVVLVTDAMAATGMPDGDYRLGPLAVRVGDRVARVLGVDGSTGAIAGGTAHLVDVVRTTTTHGVGLAAAVRAASATPAAVLGRADLGALEAGRRADVLVTDEQLRPRGVLRAGVWVRPLAG